MNFNIFLSHSPIGQIFMGSINNRERFFTPPRLGYWDDFFQSDTDFFLEVVWQRWLYEKGFIFHEDFKNVT